MGKYNSAVRMCTDKRLVEENQYLGRQWQRLKRWILKRFPPLQTYIYFADIFLKAEKLDVAKELYYTVYHRTASRTALYRLP